MKTIIISDISKDCYMNPSDSIVYIDANSGVKYQAVRSGYTTSWKRYSEVEAGSNISLNEPAFDDPSANKSIINASVGSAFAGFTEVNIDANNSSLDDPKKPIYVISAADDCKIVINHGGYVQFPPTSTLTKAIVMIYVDMGYTDLMPCNNRYNHGPEYAKYLGPDLINTVLFKDDFTGGTLSKKSAVMSYRPIGHYIVANSGSTGFKFYNNADNSSLTYGKGISTFDENIEAGDVLVSDGYSYIRIPGRGTATLLDDISNGPDNITDNWQALTKKLKSSAHSSSGVYLITANTKLANYNVLYLGDGTLN